MADLIDLKSREVKELISNDNIKEIESEEAEAPTDFIRVECRNCDGPTLHFPYNEAWEIRIIGIQFRCRVCGTVISFPALFPEREK